jgi:hypothetical protein
MKQIITGPFGRIAYFGTSGQGAGQYPSLNLPFTAFAKGCMTTVANVTSAPGVIQLPRQLRSRAALAMFGQPAKREI